MSSDLADISHHSAYNGVTEMSDDERDNGGSASFFSLPPQRLEMKMKQTVDYKEELEDILKKSKGTPYEV